MGISSANFGLITTVEELLGGWRGRRVLELGNQLLRGENTRRTSKDYFTALGAIHVSFDINGQDGAISVDLCKPVPEEYWGTFEVVTNFGTSEHVKNQEQVFRTIHDCCKVGGYMIHSIPLVGHWKGHSPYHYYSDFCQKLASAFGYQVLSNALAERFNNKLLNALLRKTAEGTFSSSRFPSTGIKKSEAYSKDSNNRW